MTLLDNAKLKAQAVAQTVMKKAIEHTPDCLIPGGNADPLCQRRNGLIGTAVSRVDGPQKVKGEARFAAEIPMDGMVYAALVYSTIPKGRILTLDSQAAEAAAGVVLVMTYKNAPRMAPPPLFMTAAKAVAGDALPVMQDERVAWNGQPIAVVLAETQEEADHAASLVVATYEMETAATVFEEAKRHTKPGTFQGEPLQLLIGEAESALDAAPFKVDATYRTPRHNHSAIELHAATVAWQDGQLIVHDATQAVTHTAWTLAQIFSLAEHQVHVTSPYVGGGFGGKTLWQHHILAIAASKLAARPVRIVLSREGVHRAVGGRSPTEQRVAIGAQADGRFDAIIHTGVTAMTSHNALPEPFILATRSAYAAGSFKLDVEVAELDMVANTFMRAPGEAVGTFALESAVDELAAQLQIDPIALRLRNEPVKDPTTDTPFSSRHIVEAYRTGAERFGWSKRQAAASRREGEWMIGMGCATATYPYYRMPGGAARLTLTEDGHVTVEVAAHEMGMGTATTHTLVTAERLGLPMSQVTVKYGDSHLPGAVLAGGSQQSASIGAAVAAAHDALITALLALLDDASSLYGVKADAVACRDGGIYKIDEPTRYERYSTILERANRAAVTVEAEGPKAIEIQHWSMHSYGALFCEVRVSAVTGEIKVDRLLGSFDTGRILNARTATRQFKGGMIKGL